jgi:uncharacterized phage protein (TIGR01671 family)
MKTKFRAWDKHGKKMFANDELIIWNGNVYANDSKKLTCNNLKGWSIDEEYLMQSTGLFDKNNKEIFEGDIIANGPDVMCMKRHNTLGFYVEQKGKVEFIADCAILEEFEEDAKEIADSLEIIGNIYENKGILEEKDEKRK